jgi:hypothetical protein
MTEVSMMVCCREKRESYKGEFWFSRRRVWRQLSSGMSHRVVWQTLTDVSEVFSASIIRASWWWSISVIFWRRGVQFSLAPSKWHSFMSSDCSVIYLSFFSFLGFMHCGTVRLLCEWRTGKNLEETAGDLENGNINWERTRKPISISEAFI